MILRIASGIYIHLGFIYCCINFGNIEICSKSKSGKAVYIDAVNIGDPLHYKTNPKL